MPSPFPGMDPYLERPHLWPDVHHELISEMRAALNRSLGSRYVARIEERVYLADDDDGQQVRVPDIRVVKNPKRGGSNGAVRRKTSITSPVTFHMMTDEEVHEARIEIRDTNGDVVITVIELLSPSNKRPGSNGFESFKKKRDEILHSEAHWVEIDLLRDGRPATVRPRHITCDYQIVVSPAWLRPKGHLWPIGLRQALPTIAIPLRKRDGDVALDVQASLASAFERGAYGRSVDYAVDPDLPLTGADATWAVKLLRKKGLRK